MHHMKTIKTEKYLHRYMFKTLVERVAGLGVAHECKPTINTKLVVPNRFDFSWTAYIEPEIQRRPRLLEYEYRF